MICELHNPQMGIAFIEIPFATVTKAEKTTKKAYPAHAGMLLEKCAF
jgi:hypothetical protein